MRTDQREMLRRRYGYRCGYCGVCESDTGAELTVDHYRPRSRGGPEDPANWVYCCFACNTRKGDTWSPDHSERILHPLNDALDQHIAEQPDGTLLGVSDTGAYHIGRLELNRPALVAYRLSQRRRQRMSDALDEALRRQEELHERVRALEQAVADAEDRLRAL